jgi:hypothetical protein
MLIQLANIACGVILLNPELNNSKTFKTFGHKLHSITHPYLQHIGIIECVLGIAMLLDRMDILRLHNLWSSYPQALIAIPMGLLLASSYFHKYELTRKIITAINPYRAYIALGGIIVGLNSLL